MTPATATVAAKPAKQAKPLPAPNSDFYEVYETLSAEELATVKKGRAFMEAKGTYQIQNLILGKAITGLSAFV